MATMSETVTTLIRTVKTGERLLSLKEPLSMAVTIADRIVEADPDLAPEMEAVKQRLLEIVAHVGDAFAVAEAKADLFWNNDEEV